MITIVPVDEEELRVFGAEDHDISPPGHASDHQS
jgi:hypothetical protein